MRGTRIAAVFVALATSLGAARSAAAQVVVQQPVIGTFGVSTVVSVPDRGRMVVGGVGRAGAARVTRGPFRSGTATGLFQDHAAVGVHAQIHDLGAMDRELLRQAAAARPRTAEPRGGDLADHAYHSLLSRWPEGRAAPRGGARRPFR